VITSRLDRLRALLSSGELSAQEVDCLLISGPPNIRYLTGFTGSNALLLLEPDSTTLYTDGRYTTQAEEEVGRAGLRVRIRIPKKGIWQTALECLKKGRDKAGRRKGKAGFDSNVSYALYQKIHEVLGEKHLQPVSGLVERLRMVKDEAEIDAIRASAELNSRVLTEVLKLVRVGVTERDLAAEIDYRMRQMGGSGPAFETIVASGVRSALPHAHPTSREIGCCEFLLFDHGTMLNGYCSDMTRTVWVGGSMGCEPGRKARELYATVLEAHQQAKEAIRAGVSSSAVDRVARRPIAARGWGKYFSHSTGHGVGLEIHEAPRLAARVAAKVTDKRGDKNRDKVNDKLPAGAVVTIEPGVYFPGFGGVRIEDMVVVREKGCEVLTPSTPSYRELLEIP